MECLKAQRVFKKQKSVNKSAQNCFIWKTLRKVFSRMEKIRLSFKEQMRLVLPYAYHNIKEQFVVVVPICLFIILFQIVILNYGLKQIGFLTVGIVLVFLGLAFFLEGIKIGLVPIGEVIGNVLPKKHSAAVVLIFAFFLGVLASIGEPVLGTLQMAGAQLKPEHAPLLYALLVGSPQYLIATVSLGVGVAVVIGTLRFLYGWSLKPIVLPLITIGIVLTIIASFNPFLAAAIGLAWDTGAVIVGPVLCPLVLALGVGVCRASGKTNPSLAGFGMVGLISIVPITFVIILTFIMYWAGVGGIHDKTHTGYSTHNPETAVVAPIAAEPVKLPSSLDFDVFYPKLRLMNLPSELDFKEYFEKISTLPQDQKENFLKAYKINEEHHSIQLTSSFPPEVRKNLPEALQSLGYDFSKSPFTIFQKVYDIKVENEELLKGTITLRSDALPENKKSIPELLTKIGYIKQGPLAIESFILGARAILPIFIFLFIVMLALKSKGPPIPIIVISACFAIIGLFLFFFGLTVGLGTMGNQLGDRLPMAFLDYLPLFPTEVSLYSSEVGKIIVVIFAIILGYGATLAEPAFNVLGQQVEDVTQGAFKKNLFSQSVALGVGVGAGLGIMSLLYNINLLYLLLPPYILLAILTYFNKELFVNIAWDGGAVTTGPVTVPLKLAIGLSLSMATGAGEGFGVLALASAYPVLNILLLGLLISYREKKRISAESGELNVV